MEKNIKIGLEGIRSGKPPRKDDSDLDPKLHMMRKHLRLAALALMIPPSLVNSGCVAGYRAYLEAQKEKMNGLL